MREYELVVILDPQLDERLVAPTLEKFLGVITAGGGSIENTDVWGKKTLAYPIDRRESGIYVVVNFTSTPAVAQELDRQLGLNESVLRTKLFRPDAA